LTLRYEDKNPYSMRALVISGGGSKGAFGGGIAEYLINDLDRNYEILIGTSTGSLLIPQLAIGHVDNIRAAYTNVNQEDVYKICPFLVKKDKSGNLYTKINHFNTLKMFLKGKKTFGDHSNLLKTIRRTFSEDEFEKLKASQKKVIVCVANFSLNIIEHKYVADFNYEDFTEWMWISTSFVPFMAIVEKNGYEYADGGFGSLVPIEEAINAGATQIDVIVLNPKYSIPEKRTTNNAFDVIMRSLNFMHNRIGRYDIYIGHLTSVYDDSVSVNFIFTPRLLTEHSFLFYAPKMQQWWQEGYDFARSLHEEGRLNTS
jgi:predicted patatin/cPLA2 family phospholipase